MTPIQTGQQAEFLSDLTLAALEDLRFDTVWDDVTSATDRTAPTPAVPIATAMV